MKSGRFADWLNMYLFCSVFASACLPFKNKRLDFYVPHLFRSGPDRQRIVTLPKALGGDFVGEVTRERGLGTRIASMVSNAGRPTGLTCGAATVYARPRRKYPADNGGISRSNQVMLNQVMGASRISTRRLDARPSGVAFEAIGCVSPSPRIEKRRWSTPCEPR